MDGTELPSIPKLSLYVDRDKVDAEEVVLGWLSKLTAAFNDRNFNNLSHLFITDCWWRDILALAWDWTTKNGQEKIGAYLRDSETTLVNLKPSTAGLKPFLVEYNGESWVQSAFSFSTMYGKGKGIVKLINQPNGEWKAWTVFTQLLELRSQAVLEVKGLQNHLSLSKSQVFDVNHVIEAPVLIIGAGQCGVSLAAHLNHMGIKNLVVDKNARVGDGWRERYESVTLHTPTWTDHYPFLSYPDNLPEFLDRDQTANFLEHYSQYMDINVQLDTRVTSIVRTGSGYEVRASSPNGEQVFHPEHVVLATGVFSDTPIVPQFKGQESFKGHIYHSKNHKTARQVPDLRTKKIVVIGSATSGHDMAQDFVNCGAEKVTMIQRSPIFSVSSESYQTVMFGLFKMGLTMEEADMLCNCTPTPILRTMGIELSRAMTEIDKEMTHGLQKAGMALLTGEDGYGLVDHQLIHGGRFYIDQGANQMIIDGRIKVHYCKGGVLGMGEKSLTMADGTIIEADVVVLATGQEKNIHTVRKIMGDDIANKLHGFGNLDEEQERKGWWRPTGVDGFWYMTGSFTWCRQFSQVLALQIAHSLGH